MKRGWCPSLNDPMESGDGWLARFSVPGWRLTAAEAREIALLAARFGNGTIELTQRANLQLRGVNEADFPALRKALVALGMGANPSHVLASPLCGIDPDCDPGAHAFAAALEIAFSQVKLPPKFLCVVDGGGALPLTHAGADVYFTAVDGGYILSTPISPTIPPPGIFPFGVTALGLPFGRMNAGMLTALSRLSDTVILSPWRMVFLPGDDIRSAAADAGFITAPGDARRFIHACSGAPGCASAEGDTLRFAQEIAAALPGLSQTLHISGCAKGCAFPREAPVAITAQNGGYTFAFNAHAGTPGTPFTMQRLKEHYATT